ncbi:recombinase family protein [Lacimicrobium alkaliphilum]|uniref:Resolvase n=1 Tax=Lacimicrobium alkaliphilum TaxID=1526571 RepID=A0A0U3AXS0_9ALTE|nr:recombinase family protein [Lacimicrobium alkaliphilum]ALS97784.1 resolvase [Lacimicrobium alkaliphilum]
MPNALKPLLYSYIRFSTAEQAKGHSLSRQMSYAKKIADERGLRLDDSLTMRDLGLSAFHGTNITKGALGTFLSAIQQGKVPVGSILLIESLDRISRRGVTDCNSIITQIINAGITVITAMDNKEYNKQLIDENPFELFAMLMIFIRANEESATKSKRVRDVLTAQCEDWLAGKREFRVKCGKAPKWVKWDENIKGFVFEPRERDIVLRKIELYKRGYGGLKIAEVLNFEFGAGTVHHTGANVYKEVKRRSLVGELQVKVGEIDYILDGYFPALITHSEFNSLVADSSKRGAIKHSQKFVGILAGIDVFKCGRCGRSVGSHVIYRKKEIDDVKSSHKRYGCIEARRNNNCSMKSTIQIDIVEKALVRFCQDKVNLQRILLNGSDRDDINAEEVQLKTRLEKVERNIDSLLETLLILTEEPPQAIANKIRTLESEVIDIREKITVNKNKLARIDNSYRDEVTERWLSLTENLNRLDSERRLQLRQLVKDTFKSVTLQVDVKEKLDLKGLESLIDAQLTGGQTDKCFDLTLEFHNGKKRMLRLDKYSGELMAGFDLA